MVQSTRREPYRALRHASTRRILDLYCKRFRNLRPGEAVYGAQSYDSAVSALRALHAEYGDDMFAKLVDVNKVIRESLQRASTDLAAVLPEHYYSSLYAELGDEWLDSMKRPSRLYLVPPKYDTLSHECFVFEDCALHVDWASQVAYELRSPYEIAFFRNRILNYQAILPEVDCRTLLSTLEAAGPKVSDIRALSIELDYSVHSSR